MLSICPHWYLLHEIFGSNASSALPFQFSMNQSAVMNGDNEPRTNGDHIKSEPMQFVDETLGDSDSGDLAHSSDSYQCQDDYVNHSQVLSNHSHVENVSPQQLPPPRAPDLNGDSFVTNFRHSLSTLVNEHQQRKQQQQQQQSDDRSMDAYQVKYLKLLEQRHKLDAQRLSNENNIKLRELQLASERHEFDKMCRLKELDLKRAEIESNERLRLLEMEKSERMEKLKIELDFKIQLAQLGGATTSNGN